jgi:uridine kinase
VILNAELVETVKITEFSMVESAQVGEKAIVLERRIVIEGLYLLYQVKSVIPFKVYLATEPEVQLNRKRTERKNVVFWKKQ